MFGTFRVAVPRNDSCSRKEGISFFNSKLCRADLDVNKIR